MQWYRPGVARTIAVVNDCGETIPVSSRLSSSTMWWTLPSTLCHTTICPDDAVEGFGENERAPLMPTMSITTAPAGGVLVGALVGPVGAELLYDEPQAATARSGAAAKRAGRRGTHD